MTDDLVKILDGNTFVVSDDARRHRSVAHRPDRLFSFDTRFLSKWVLTIDGQRLNPLSVDDLQYFETRFFLVPGHGHRLRRRQALGDPPARRGRRLPRGAHDPEPRRQAGRARRAHRGRQRLRRPVRGQGRAEEEGQVLLARIDDGRSCWATRARPSSARRGSSASAAGDVDEQGLTFAVTIEPHGEWTTDLHVVTAGSSAAGEARRTKSSAAPNASPTWSASLEKWLDDAPRLECDWDRSKRDLPRSLVDLAALRFSPLDRCPATACRRPACPGS